MSSRKAALAALMVALCSSPALPQARPPTEAQCRQMVDGMIQTMKRTPMSSERDRQGAQALIERAERIVRDHRSRGLSECETWAAIGKLVASQ